LSSHLEHDNPNSTPMHSWTIDQFEAHAAALEGRHLEAVRELAQSRAYQPGESREARLRWAALSLDANRRGHGDAPWDQARMQHQDFMLRTWIIEHLGPAPHPAWNPQVLAADTLAALTLDPAQAEDLSTNWRSLPIEQIRELRRHKNLTAHLNQLISHLEPGRTKEGLTTWIDARKRLP
jgi:hypothetical protein